MMSADSVMSGFSVDILGRCQGGKATKSRRGQESVARRVSQGASASGYTSSSTAACIKTGDGRAILAQNAGIVINAQTALGVEQRGHRAARVEWSLEGSKAIGSPPEGIRLALGGSRIVSLDGCSSALAINALGVNHLFNGVTLLQAFVLPKFGKLFLGHGNLEDALVEDREGELAFSQHVLGVAGIAEAFVTESVAVRIDDDAALLDRRPAQDRAMWISNSGIALIGFHILQAGAKFLAPLDRFTIGTERTEILCSRNFGNETLHELTIVAEAVGSQDHRM